MVVDTQTEQLQQLHWPLQQQLNRDQLEQLKTFKTQLMNDVLTQLSPRSVSRESKTGTPGHKSPQNDQLSLSLEEAGHLLSPHFPCPTHHSTADQPPPVLSTPIKPPISSAAKKHVSPSPPHPPFSSTISSHTHTLAPDITDLHMSNLSSTPPQHSLNLHTLQVQLPEYLQVPPSSTLSPNLSLECPQIPPPPTSPDTATTTPPTITHTPLPPEALDSHSQQISISETYSLRCSPNPAPLQPADDYHSPPHAVGHYTSPTASPTTHPLPPTVQRTLNTHSAARTTPTERHTRHVEDLTQYYESKLEELQRELTRSSERNSSQPLPLNNAKPQDHRHTGNPKSSIATPHEYASVRSPVLPVTKRLNERLQADNERLKAECTKLQIMLKQHDMYVYSSHD